MSKQFYYTHIWDIEEYAWFLDHRDSMLFSVPTCGEYYQSTRKHKLPLLVMTEAMLVRGTSESVACPVCAYVNLQIRQGTVQDPDIWDDLATGPKEQYERNTV